MGQNFISFDRDQVFLFPPSLTDWLHEDHLVWTVLGAVEQINLDGFYGVYRANGQGRAAYDPRMVVSLLLYSYCVGVRSSRQIERCCRGDVAFKVVTALEVPDHSTIAEFRRRHQDAVAGLSSVEVLALCGEARLVTLGEIAVDGTKMHASASFDRYRGYASIVEEISSRPNGLTVRRISGSVTRGGMSCLSGAHPGGTSRCPGGGAGADQAERVSVSASSSACASALSCSRCSVSS